MGESTKRKEKLDMEIEKYRWLINPLAFFLKEQKIMQVGFDAIIPIREEGLIIQELSNETKVACSSHQADIERKKLISGQEPALGGFAFHGDMFQEPKIF